MIDITPAGSIRRRLVWQLVLAAALLAALLYYSIRTVADEAVELTQDRILGAAVLSMAEALRGGEDGVDIDIPYDAFSMLGAIGNDRIFYRFVVGDVTATGYHELPLPPQAPSGLEPSFYSSNFQDEPIRVAAVSRRILVDNDPVSVLVLVAQTRVVQQSIVAGLANRAAALGLGFFGLAALLSAFMARSVLQPINELAGAVSRRGPQDLRPVARQVPVELQPMVRSLNGFISRLSGALSRTETFIAEAAHYIRTPLATLRTQSEIALHQSPDSETSDRLRRIIRLADDTARSAGQLLDHAAVIYRTDQRSDEALDLAGIVHDVSQSFRPSAELKDITISVDAPEPQQVLADRVLVETVVRNLIDNAVKYSDSDSIVELHLAAKEGFAELRVSDSGRGLNGVDSAKLTERFGRGDNVADVVGSGLGLAMVTDVARAYRGKFELSERQGGGTCAIFSLPLH